MNKASLDLKKDFKLIRQEFPILEKCVYLISNSLRAVPRRAKKHPERYYRPWAEEGVKAWEKEWWYLAQRVATAISSLIGASSGEVTMVPNATIGYWLVLSCLFSKDNKKKKKIIFITESRKLMFFLRLSTTFFLQVNISIIQIKSNTLVRSDRESYIVSVGSAIL